MLHKMVSLQFSVLVQLLWYLALTGTLLLKPKRYDNSNDFFVVVLSTSEPEIVCTYMRSFLTLFTACAPAQKPL